MLLMVGGTALCFIKTPTPSQVVLSGEDQLWSTLRTFGDFGTIFTFGIWLLVSVLIPRFGARLSASLELYDAKFMLDEFDDEESEASTNASPMLRQRKSLEILELVTERDLLRDISQQAQNNESTIILRNAKIIHALTVLGVALPSCVLQISGKTFGDIMLSQVDGPGLKALRMGSAVCIVLLGVLSSVTSLQAATKAFTLFGQLQTVFPMAVSKIVCQVIIGGIVFNDFVLYDFSELGLLGLGVATCISGLALKSFAAKEV